MQRRHPGSFDIVSVKDGAGHVFATRLQNIFSMGHGTRAMVSMRITSRWIESLFLAVKKFPCASKRGDITSLQVLDFSGIHRNMRNAQLKGRPQARNCGSLHGRIPIREICGTLVRNPSGSAGCINRCNETK